MGEGDLDCNKAFSTLSLPKLLTIWEYPLMNLATCEMEEGKVVCGWSCGYCPHPARGPPKFHKHITMQQRPLPTSSKWKATASVLERVSFPIPKKCSIKPFIMRDALRKGKGGRGCSIACTIYFNYKHNSTRHYQGLVDIGSCHAGPNRNHNHHCHHHQHHHHRCHCHHRR